MKGSYRVYLARRGEAITKRFGKSKYRLYAYGYYPNEVRDYAEKLQRTLGKKVIVREVWDERVGEGQPIDFGVWVLISTPTKVKRKAIGTKAKQLKKTVTKIQTVRKKREAKKWLEYRG